MNCCCCCLKGRVKVRVCPLCGEAHYKYVDNSMSEEDFKERFKVGDIIKAFSTRIRYKITAIGERRFLARCVDRNFHEKERAFGMTTANNYELERSEPCPAARESRGR